MSRRLAELAARVAERLGEPFTVDADRSTLLAQHTGGGRAVVWLEPIDGRRAITEEQVAGLVEKVATTFRRDARDRRYTERARAASAAAAADLLVGV